MIFIKISNKNKKEFAIIYYLYNIYATRLDN